MSLEIEGLEKRFGDVRAVQGIDLSIGRGESFTFLGPSGCGKTTILRVVAASTSRMPAASGSTART